jgi:hypothetical protein
MDLNSPQDAHLRELLDTLRPGSDDLSRSEFAELAQRLQRDPQFKEMAARSQRLDQAISDAMHDLPIPAGSVDRLLARLDVPPGPAKQGAHGAVTTARAVSASGQVRDTPPLAPTSASGSSATAKSADASAANLRANSNVKSDNKPYSDPVQDGASRRRKLKLGLIEVGVLAVAASLAAVAYFVSGSAVAYNADQIVGEVQQFATTETPDAWQQLATNPPPARLARFAIATNSGLTAKPAAWREVHDLLSRSGVAYELHSGAVQATLYVVERDPPKRSAPRFEDLLPVPPTKALIDTGGRAVSAWAQGNLLYVLVVVGGPQQYKAFVAQRGPLAML